MRILIVDDSLMARLQVRNFLELIGFAKEQCLFAGNGDQALELIEQGGIDVLISDLNMPVLDGLELVRAMNDGKMAEPPKIIMVTSAVGDALVTMLTKLGVGAVIAKPVTLEKLTTACNDIRILPPSPPPASG